MSSPQPHMSTCHDSISITLSITLEPAAAVRAYGAHLRCTLCSPGPCDDGVKVCAMGVSASSLSSPREHRLLTLASCGDAQGLRLLWKEEEELRRRRRGAPHAAALSAALDVDAHAPDGDCALHLAAVVGGDSGLQCVELLVEQFGCAVDAREASGCTALMLAVEARQESVVRFLCLSTDADVDAQDAQGRTALHRAALSPHSTLLGLLLRTRCAVDVQDCDGQSPLLLALLEQRKEDRAAAASSSASHSRRDSRSAAPTVEGGGDGVVAVADPSSVAASHPFPFSTPQRGRLSLSGSPSPPRSPGAPSPPASPSSSSVVSSHSRASSSLSLSSASPCPSVSAGRSDVLVRLLQAGADLSLTNRVAESGWSLAQQVGVVELCVTAVRKRERDRCRQVELALHDAALQQTTQPAAASPSSSQPPLPPSIPPLPRLPLAVLDIIRAYDSHQLVPQLASLQAPLEQQHSPHSSHHASAAHSNVASPFSSLTSLAAQASATLRRGSLTAHHRQLTPTAVSAAAATAASSRRQHARTRSSSRYERVNTADDATLTVSQQQQRQSGRRRAAHAGDSEVDGRERGEADAMGGEEEEEPLALVEPLEADDAESPSPSPAFAEQLSELEAEGDEEEEDADDNAQAASTARRAEGLELASLTLSIERTSTDDHIR